MYLSKRAVLLRSALSSLSIYFLSLFTALILVINRIERIQRDFLWQADQGCKRSNVSAGQGFVAPWNNEGWELDPFV